MVIIKVVGGCMKKLFEKINKNKIFIVLIIIVGIISFFMYKVLKTKPIIRDNDLYIKSSVELKSDDLDENKKIVVDAKQKKRLNLLIKNNFNSKKEIYVWYKVEDNNKVKVGNLFSSKIKLSKDGLTVEENGLFEVEIGIKNDLEVATTVEFGIIYDNGINDINNYLLINEVFQMGKQKSFIVGDKVRLKDNSSWHVIEESNSSDIYITLLKDEVIRIEDNTSNIDVKNNMVLHETTDENISFYLDNNYRKDLEDKNIQIGEDGEIRLITLNELQAIGQYQYKDYNYYAKDIPDWFIIKSPWWTMTPFSNDSHYYVDGKNILSIKDVKKVRASIRPVIKMLKSNIK